MENSLFDVWILDGHFFEVDDTYNTILDYRALKWEEALELMRLSLLQGFETVICRIQTDNQEHGG